MKKTVWAGVMAAAILGVASTAVLAESTPAKKELVAKLLALQQNGSMALATQLAENPAMRLMQQAGPVLQFRVPPEKREAVGKEIQADIKKYVDDTVPMLRERVVKLAPGVVGPILEEKFSEDELKQIIAFYESPAQRKFAQASVDMQKALSERLVAETKPLVEPKVKVLEESISQRLRTAIGASATTTPAPASK